MLMGSSAQRQYESSISGQLPCYVGDNTDIIVMNEALKLVHKNLVNVINELAKFAVIKNLPTPAFTHFQPAADDGWKEATL